jgi:tetratricopeptide (TPR) repeat protein
VAEGRLDDAAKLLDPIPARDIDPVLGWNRVYLRLLQRRNAEAIADAEELLARPDISLDGWRTRITLYLGFAKLRAGDSAGAKETFAALAERIEPMKDHVDDSQTPADLAVAYAGAGRKADALSQAERAVRLFANDGIDRPYAEGMLLVVQGMTGDREAAITKIAPLLQEPAGLTPALLRLDPMWDPFRGDPRFEKLASAELVPWVPAAPR